MTPVERILCPVDPATDSGRALRYAAALAAAYGARLTALTCVADSGDTDRRAAEDALRLALGRAAADAGAQGLDWETAVVAGRGPAEAITDEAAARRADLIVMCSRRRPLRAALIGSTAERVYRTAPCPVLVTHPDRRGWEDRADGSDDAAGPARVLVAHDFSDHAESALACARAFARRGRSELHLLHVLPAPVNEPELAWGATATEGAYHRAARRLQRSAAPEARHWRSVVSSVRWGKPYREVLAYAKEQEIDLVCMGAHGANFDAQAVFGSNVDRVLRQSPCPALVARPLRPLYVPVAARDRATAAAREGAASRG